MFIPLGTDRPLRRRTAVTPALIVVTAAAFCAQLLLGRDSAFVNSMVLAPGSSGFWTYVTYALLHDDSAIWHIVFNMLFLWVFGPNVEDRFGRLGFLAFYVFGAVAAGLGHAATTQAPVIGASGAVSAVTGAFFVLFPRTRVRTFVLFFIITVLMVPSWFFIGLAVARDLISSVGAGSSRVAYTAHLAGYAFGAGVAASLLATKRLKREPYDLLALGRQAGRRREIRSATRRQEQERARRIGRPAAPVAVPAAREEMGPSHEHAEARAAVSTAVAEGRLDEAALLYRELLRESNDGAERPPARDDGSEAAAWVGVATLGRGAMYDLGGHFYREGSFEEAAEVYRRFLDAYPKDREAPEIRLLLGRLLARRLGRLDEGRALLRRAAEELGDGELRSMARAELDGLNGQPVGGGGGGGGAGAGGGGGA